MMISGRKSCEKEEGLLALSFKMVDIYDDLEDPFFSIQQDIESSEVASSAPSISNEELDELQEENSKLTIQNAALKKNISCLYKTARLEIDRKESMIESLKKRINKLQYNRKFDHHNKFTNNRGKKLNEDEDHSSPLSKDGRTFSSCNGEVLDSSPSLHKSTAGESTTKVFGNGSQNGPLPDTNSIDTNSIDTNRMESVSASSHNAVLLPRALSDSLNKPNINSPSNNHGSVQANGKLNMPSMYKHIKCSIGVGKESTNNNRYAMEAAHQSERKHSHRSPSLHDSDRRTGDQDELLNSSERKLDDLRLRLSRRQHRTDLKRHMEAGSKRHREDDKRDHMTGRRHVDGHMTGRRHSHTNGERHMDDHVMERSHRNQRSEKNATRSSKTDGDSRDRHHHSRTRTTNASTIRLPSRGVTDRRRRSRLEESPDYILEQKPSHKRKLSSRDSSRRHRHTPKHGSSAEEHHYEPDRKKHRDNPHPPATTYHQPKNLSSSERVLSSGPFEDVDLVSHKDEDSLSVASDLTLGSLDDLYPRVDLDGEFETVSEKSGDSELEEGEIDIDGDGSEGENQSSLSCDVYDNGDSNDLHSGDNHKLYPHSGSDHSSKNIDFNDDDDDEVSSLLSLSKSDYSLEAPEVSLPNNEGFKSSYDESPLPTPPMHDPCTPVRSSPQQHKHTSLTLTSSTPPPDVAPTAMLTTPPSDVSPGTPVPTTPPSVHQSLHGDTSVSLQNNDTSLTLIRSPRTPVSTSPKPPQHSPPREGRDDTPTPASPEPPHHSPPREGRDDTPTPEPSHHSPPREGRDDTPTPASPEPPHHSPPREGRDDTPTPASPEPSHHSPPREGRDDTPTPASSGPSHHSPPRDDTPTPASPEPPQHSPLQEGRDDNLIPDSPEPPHHSHPREGRDDNPSFSSVPLGSIINLRQTNSFSDPPSEKSQDLTTNNIYSPNLSSAPIVHTTVIAFSSAHVEPSDAISSKETEEEGLEKENREGQDKEEDIEDGELTGSSDESDNEDGSKARCTLTISSGGYTPCSITDIISPPPPPPSSRRELSRSRVSDCCKDVLDCYRRDLKVERDVPAAKHRDSCGGEERFKHSSSHRSETNSSRRHSSHSYSRRSRDKGSRRSKSPTLHLHRVQHSSIGSKPSSSKSQFHSHSRPRSGYLS